MVASASGERGPHQRSWRLPGRDSHQERGITPYRLGITPNKYDTPEHLSPYVSRDIHKELDDALQTQRLILLVGASTSGKSRTAFEAVRRMASAAVRREEPEPRLLLPSPGKGLYTGTSTLKRFFSFFPRPEWGPGPAVLWLDDVQKFLEDLSPSMLDTLTQQERRIIVVATLRSDRYELLRQGEGLEARQQFTIGAGLWSTLERFETFFLDAALTAPEFQQALGLYPNEPEEGLRRGLGEQLTAADVLLRKFRAGRSGIPEGYALVQAAIDWRRADLERPIPEKELRSLARLYLPGLRANLNLTDETYKRSLDWALHTVGQHIALLSEAQDDGDRAFQVFDHTLSYVEYQRTPIPEKTWTFLLENTSPDEKVSIATMAYLRNETQVAERAVERVLKSGHADAVPKAAVNLGALREMHGDLEGARAAYQQALGSGHADIISRAQESLRVLSTRKEAEGSLHTEDGSSARQ